MHISESSNATSARDRRARLKLKAIYRDPTGAIRPDLRSMLQRNKIRIATRIGINLLFLAHANGTSLRIVAYFRISTFTGFADLRHNIHDDTEYVTNVNNRFYVIVLL